MGKMSSCIDISVLRQAENDIKNQWPDVKPEMAIVLGSGWDEVVNAFKIKDEVPYKKITGMGDSSVKGHAGKLSLAEYQGKEIFIFQGRRHWYEGEGWTPVVAPVYITKQCGAEILFLTNAAGGISCEAGELMIINDHINHMFSNPLIGPQYDDLGTRFPDMSYTYNKELIAKMKKASELTGVPVKEGVYIAATGPTYETPAEIQAFKGLGADVIGMSTVPEAIVGNSMGLKIAGMSCVANHAAGISETPLTHDEVVTAIAAVMSDLARLIPETVKQFLC